MNKTLHILNGDSTAESFAKSSLEGDVLIWREMLCEGSLDILPNLVAPSSALAGIGSLNPPPSTGSLLGSIAICFEYPAL